MFSNWPKTLQIVSQIRLLRTQPKTIFRSLTLFPMTGRFTLMVIQAESFRGYWSFALIELGKQQVSAERNQPVKTLFDNQQWPLVAECRR